MMDEALRKAGVPVETLYYPTEGHGFYAESHRREFYTRLLDFLHRQIGGATALPVSDPDRSEEHTSELQSLMRISYAFFCLKKKITSTTPDDYLCIDIRI